MRRTFLRGLLVLAGLCAVRATDTRDLLAKRLELRFSPGNYEKAAISKDGRFLAYTKREKDDLFVYVVPTATPDRLLGKVRVGTPESSVQVVPIYQPSDVPIPPEVLSLTWMGDRVVAYTNLCIRHASLSGGVYTMTGALLAFDPDGGHAKIITTAADYPELSRFRVLDERHVIVPYRDARSLGFDRILVPNRFIAGDDWRDPRGRGLPLRYSLSFDTFTPNRQFPIPYRAGDDYYSIDVVTGRERESDRGTWNGASLHRQDERYARRSVHADNGDLIRALMAGQKVTPLDVSSNDDLVAFRAASTADPGAFYLYSQNRRKLYEIGRCQPEIDPARYVVSRWTATFSGKPATELMIAPASGGDQHRGVFVMATDSKGAEADPGYQREAMAVADMGYTVLLLGLPPEGNVQRELEFDRAVETELGAAFPGFADDPVPVVLLGQTRVANFIYRLPFVRPALYSGVVFLEPPKLSLANPVLALGSDGQLAAAPASMKQGASVGLGLCFHWADRTDRWRVAPINASAARRFCDGLGKIGIDFSYTPVNPVAVGLGEPKAMADQYLHIYGFIKEAPRPGGVKLGPTQTVKLSAAVGKDTRS